MTDPAVVAAVAKAIYEAKKQDAWGNWQSEHRGKWPETPKVLRACLHNESDIGVHFAFVQAKAAIEAYERMMTADESEGAA